MRARLRELVAGLMPEADAGALAERLAAYAALVQRYGARINLAGDLRDAFLAEQLIGGSLQLLRAGRPGGRLVDVGSGAGVPGIPLALALPDLDVTLVEVRQKRAAFLRRAVALLALERVSVLDRDVADVPGGFDWAVARAFKAPAEWLPIGARLVGEGGRIGVYTTRDAWRGVAPPAGFLVVEEAADPTGEGRIVVVVKSEI